MNKGTAAALHANVYPALGRMTEVRFSMLKGTISFTEGGGPRLVWVVPVGLLSIYANPVTCVLSPASKLSALDGTSQGLCICSPKNSLCIVAQYLFEQHQGS